MGWRDLIVTSQQREIRPAKPSKGHIEDIEDFGLKYKNKSSFSLNKSPQNSIPTNPSSISSKPISPECVPNAPTAPLQPGWLVVYRNSSGRLCGGADDRLHGTVDKCLWNGTAWALILTDRQRLPLRAITSVGKTDIGGRVVAAWDVRGHGLNGEGQRS